MKPNETLRSIVALSTQTKANVQAIFQSSYFAVWFLKHSVRLNAAKSRLVLLLHFGGKLATLPTNMGLFGNFIGVFWIINKYINKYENNCLFMNTKEEILNLTWIAWVIRISFGIRLVLLGFVWIQFSIK